MFVYDKGLGGGGGGWLLREGWKQLLCHICEPQGKYHSWKYKTMILRWREGLSYRSWKALAVLRFILVENGHKYLNIIYVSRLHHLFILQIVWVGWMSRTDNFPVMNQLSLTYLSLRPLLLRPQWLPALLKNPSCVSGSSLLFPTGTVCVTLLLLIYQPPDTFFRQPPFAPPPRTYRSSVTGWWQPPPWGAEVGERKVPL